MKQFVFADESGGGHSENEVYEHLENIEQVNNVDVVISKKNKHNSWVHGYTKSSLRVLEMVCVKVTWICAVWVGPNNNNWYVLYWVLLIPLIHVYPEINTNYHM